MLLQKEITTSQGRCKAHWSMFMYSNRYRNNVDKWCYNYTNITHSHDKPIVANDNTVQNLRNKGSLYNG